MNDQDYIDAYIKTINVSPNNTKELFSIGMIGLNGTGKSTLANALGKELNLYVASTDKVRRWLNTQGFDGESPAQELLQKIAEAGSRYLYENKISHIIDADLIKFHVNARANAKSYGAELYLVHLVTPENIVIDRLNERKELIEKGQQDGLSMVGPDEYYKRKQLHSELELPADILLTIDGSYDIMDSVSKVKNALKQKNAI